MRSGCTTPGDHPAPKPSPRPKGARVKPCPSLPVRWILTGRTGLDAGDNGPDLACGGMDRDAAQPRCPVAGVPAVQGPPVGFLGLFQRGRPSGAKTGAKADPRAARFAGRLEPVEKLWTHRSW